MMSGGELQPLLLWISQLLAGAHESPDPLVYAPHWRQLAGLLRRVEHSPELEPVIRLVSSWCDVTADVLENLAPKTGGV